MKEISHRIEYIDALKGFAILLVVMGHTINKFYAEPYYDRMLQDYPMVTMFWWLVIYSFHMPLFMFISGFLFHRADGYTWQQGLHALWKRTYTLLLPCVVWGLIMHYIFHTKWELWFLRSLFTFVLIALIYEVPRRYIVNKWVQVVCDLLFYTLSGFTIRYAVTFLPLEIQTLLDFRWSMYLFFCLGILFRRYHGEKLLQHQWVFTVSLLMYIGLFYCQRMEYHIIPFQPIVCSLSAVLTIWYLFLQTTNGTTKWGGYLVRIGKYTLEIYILHMLVSFHLPCIGEAIIQMAQSENIRLLFGASTLQLVSSLILSVITIEISIVVRNVLSKSRVLSLALLGRKE